MKALAQVEARERKGLDVKRLREQRVHQRHGHDHMPALNLDLKPRGRGAAVRRAKDRYRGRTGADEGRVAVPEAATDVNSVGQKRREGAIDLQQALQEAIVREEPWAVPVDLAGDFARAAGGAEDGGDGGGDGVPPVRISRAERKDERVAALEERRQAEAEGPDHRSLEVRFGPGSFGCHEALHATQLIVDLMERELLDHSAVLLNPFWYDRVKEAQGLLRGAYSAAAQQHLDAPLSGGGGPRLFVVPKE